MKKLIIIVILGQTFLLTVFGLQVYKNKTEATLLYDNKTVVNFVLDSPVNNFIDYLNSLAAQTTVTKYVYIDDENMIVYTNDLTMHGVLKLADLPIDKPAEQFIANYASGKKKQLAKFNSYIPNVNITIRPFAAMLTAGGIDGQYYFSSTPHIDEIIATLANDYGTAELYDAAAVTRFGQYLQETEHLYIAILLLFCLLAFILIHYGIDRGKKIAVLKVHGLRLGHILAKIVKEFKQIIIYGSLVGLIVVISASTVFSLSDHWLAIIIMYVMMLVSVFFFSALIIALTLMTMNSVMKVPPLIKGAKPYKAIIFLHLCLKTVFLVFFLVGTANLFQAFATIKTYEKRYENWKKTENYYATVTKVSVSYRETHAKLLNFYQKMEDHGALMIDADNYSETMNAEGNIAPLYELNTTGEESYYSSYGKSIIVNLNYLKKYPALSNGNADSVREQIIFDSNVRNILVPQSLAKYEDKLKANYLENFYFQQVGVENDYNMEEGLPLNETKIEDLELNLIYIDDGYEAFSYDPYVEAENNFTIKDPVIVVETGNVDLSYYVAYLSHCMYFYYEGLQPYEDILPLVTEAGVSSEIQSVEPLYDYFGKLIRDINKEKNYLQVALSMSAVVFLVTGYLATASYFADRKLKLYVQKVHGYTLGQRIKPFATILLILSSVTIAGSYFGKGDIRIFLLGLGVLIIDLLFVFGESSYLDKKAGNLYD